MKRIRIIAAVSAVVTALAIYIYLSNIHKPVDVQRGPVVVAAQKIDAGKVVTADMVEVKDLPLEAINDQAARSADEVVGRVSSADAEPGEQLLVSRFYRAGEANDTLAYSLEKGQRAFTVDVDPETGVSGLVKPRDHVDVLAILSVNQLELKPVLQDGKSTDDPGAISYTIGDKVEVVYSLLPLQDILVLATGQVMQANATDEQTTVEQVTLSVTPDQAVLLNYIASEGKIRLVLRSPIDTDTVDVQPQIIDDIIPPQPYEDALATLSGTPAPGAAATDAPAPAPTPAPASAGPNAGVPAQ